MTFDPCEHQKTQIVLKAGAIIRQLKGLPEENNITTLYEETAPLLGVTIVKMSSQTANHLPSPAEMKDQAGKFIVRRKDCPQCGRKESMQLVALCQTCEDAEHGKYKTMWLCGGKDLNGNFIPGSGCEAKDKSPKFYTQWMTEMGIEIPTGPKKDFGIQTMTDKGLK